MVLSLFGKNNRSLLGVDISPTAIKLLGMSKIGAGFQVDCYGVEPLPAGAMVEQNIVDVEAVGDVIARLVAKTQPTTKRAAVAVPASAVITKIIEMDANLNEDDREMQLRLEADQHIPFPLDEIRMDFQVLAPLERNPERVKVLLVAARVEHVELRSDALEIGGLKPVVVDVEPYAIERAFSLMTLPSSLDDKTALVAIFDIGSTVSALHVLQAGKTVYTREQAYGSQQLIEEIQRRYGLSLAEAAIAQRSGDLPEDYTVEVLTPFKERLVQQIDRSLQLFFSSTPHDAIDYLLLAGGIAATQGLSEKAHEVLEVPCDVADPLSHLATGSRVSRSVIASDAPALLTACGLAMRAAAGGTL